jgi:hypothetical protein
MVRSHGVKEAIDHDAWQRQRPPKINKFSWPTISCKRLWKRGDGETGGDMAGYSPDRFAADVSRRSGSSLATGAGVSGHSRSGSSHRCKLRAQQRTQSAGAPRPPSAWTEHRPTVIIHGPVFSSKPKRNVACVQRLKTLFCWGLPPLSGRNMPATASDTPTGCPAWNQQMRAPELPNSWLWNRIRVGPPLCGPPLNLFHS